MTNLQLIFGMLFSCVTIQCAADKLSESAKLAKLLKNPGRLGLYMRNPRSDISLVLEHPVSKSVGSRFQYHRVPQHEMLKSSVQTDQKSSGQRSSSIDQPTPILEEGPVLHEVLRELQSMLDTRLSQATDEFIDKIVNTIIQFQMAVDFELKRYGEALDAEWAEQTETIIQKALELNLTDYEQHIKAILLNDYRQELIKYYSKICITELSPICKNGITNLVIHHTHNAQGMTEAKEKQYQIISAMVQAIKNGLQDAR